MNNLQQNNNNRWLDDVDKLIDNVSKHNVPDYELSKQFNKILPKNNTNYMHYSIIVVSILIVVAFVVLLYYIIKKQKEKKKEKFKKLYV
jgi:hypothetical protein